MRLLLVEDNPLVAMMLEEELTRGGHLLLGPTASAADAREIVAGEPCDCAIIDMDLLDGRTGGDLAAELARGSATPVVFATGQPELAEGIAPMLSECW